MFFSSLLYSLPSVSCSNLKLMRIRKNSKFSPLLAQRSSGHSHICQLNQSPWDVHTSNSFAYPQVDGVDSFTGNGSWGVSVGALDRVASLNISMEVEGYDNSNNYGDVEEEEKNETIYCGKADANGNLLCGREAKHGHTMCEFHLVHFQKGNNNNSGNVDGSKKSGKKRVKKSKPETNPYEMYYYSWFGPRWGKKRGADHDLAEGVASVEPMVETSDQANDATLVSTNSRCNESFEFIEDDYEDEDDGDDDEIMDGGNGKKRARKPIKARSLKSLM